MCNIKYDIIILLSDFISLEGMIRLKKILVGYTGFVGSNIYNSIDFDGVFNSKNIEEAFGTNPDLLIYSGVPAQKFMANKFPEKDLEIINNAIENIKKINPKKIVLISTIDVYKNPVDVDEETKIDYINNDPYGKNRYILEKWIMNNYNDYLIVRLPGLYGNNIKKNFIYDLINVIPSMLKYEKYDELCSKNNFIKDFYIKQDNGFYKLKETSEEDKKELKKYFNNIGFNALNFTDSRGLFQFYNLSFLWKHIDIALKNNIKILNLATEPITISELYNYVIGNEFINEITDNVPNYNYKTIYYNLFNGNNGYIFNKEFVLNDIKQFINNSSGVKLSISNIGWNDESDEEMYKYISNMGFKGLEIAPTRIIKNNSYDKLEEIRKFYEYIKLKYNLNISSMQSIWYGKTQNIFGSEEERQELIDYTKKAINFADVINCNNLVFGCPKNRCIPENMSKEEAVNIFVNFLKEVGEYAKSKNIVFSIEANPTIYNTNFINTTKEALEIVKKVDMSSIKVNLDLGTMIYNNEDINILINNMKYINHIHISEPYLEKIEQRELHSKLFKILSDSKYSKFVSIEMKNNKNLEDVKDTINYIRRLFK